MELFFNFIRINLINCLHIYSRAAETLALEGIFEADEGLYENPTSSSSSRFKFADVFAPKGGELLFSSLFIMLLALL